MTDSAEAFFTKTLLEWYQPSDRPLPWKGIKNPYYIWLSEIILQQTRVEQGLPYYLKFVEQYSSIDRLAAAPQDELYKLWEGLGYYSRARNLHAAAKAVMEEHGGKFPDNYTDIRALKGVGDYTAAAIASFAYDLPHAVVDGNVYRVLSRFFGIETPIDTTAGKKEFRALADRLLPADLAAKYNQAIMDFGATHCSPKQPKCQTCLHQSECKAFATNKVAALPVKSKKLKKRKRYFYYLVVEQPKASSTQLYLRKRGDQDVWAGLYDFPLIELDQAVEGFFLENTLRQSEAWQALLGNQQVTWLKRSNWFKQTLSHQHIHALFIHLKAEADFFVKNEAIMAIDRKKINNFAFPKIVVNYLKTIEL